MFHDIPTFLFLHIIGKSRQFSNSGWDELSRGQASVTSKLLPMYCILSAKESKRFLYRWPSCCKEPCRDTNVSGKGLHLCLFLLILANKTE